MPRNTDIVSRQYGSNEALPAVGLADNALRLIGIPGREFALKSDMEEISADILKDVIEQVQPKIDTSISTAINSLSAVSKTGLYSDLISKPNIPTKTSEIDNDSDYQTSEEVQELINESISEITSVEFKVVDALPETGEKAKIYLVPASKVGEDNIYDEYIWVTDKFEKIGTTEIDLSNYYTKEETDTLIENAESKHYTKEEVDENFATKEYVDTIVGDIASILASINGGE